MPRMTVKVYTTLKDKIGASRVDVQADTAEDAVRALREKYPDIVNKTLVDSEGIVRNHFTLTLNSQILDPHKLKDIPVKEGDLLHIFPPIAGGLRPFLTGDTGSRPYSAPLPQAGEGRGEAEGGKSLL